jgi:hypothetical protein
MAIILNGTTGITTPDITSTTSSLGALTQALDLGNTGQIVFPATQVASANANTLDDYEEGTWTPLAGNGVTAITSVLKATYIKIGRLVTIDLDCTVNNPNPTNNHFIYGLPFPGMASTGNGGGCAGLSNGGAVIGLHVTGNTTSLYAVNPVSGAPFNLSGLRIIFSTSYTVLN